MLNLIHDAQELERSLASMRQRKEKLQDEIAACEKQLALRLYQIEVEREAELAARIEGQRAPVAREGE